MLASCCVDGNAAPCQVGAIHFSHSVLRIGWVLFWRAATELLVTDATARLRNTPKNCMCSLVSPRDKCYLSHARIYAVYTSPMSTSVVSGYHPAIETV
eukprot:4038186-Pyramimonas_sp.AAC.1